MFSGKLNAYRKKRKRGLSIFEDIGSLVLRRGRKASAADKEGQFYRTGEVEDPRNVERFTMDSERVTVIYSPPPGRAIHNLARGRLQMVCPVLPSSQIISERPPRRRPARGERARRGPFVIPTSNIFLKTRFRSDFAPIPGRARTEELSFHDE